MQLRTGEVQRWTTQASTTLAPASRPWTTAPAVSVRTAAVASREPSEKPSEKPSEQPSEQHSPSGKGGGKKPSGETTRPGGRSYLTTAETKERLKQKELEPPTHAPRSPPQSPRLRAASPKSRARPDGSLGKVYGELPIGAGGREKSPPVGRLTSLVSLAGANPERKGFSLQAPSAPSSVEGSRAGSPTIRRQGSWVRTSAASAIESLPRRVSSAIAGSRAAPPPVASLQKAPLKKEDATPSAQSTPPRLPETITIMTEVNG